MPLAAALLLALAAQAGDPCVLTDAEGRSFPICFDPGNRLELRGAGTFGDRAPAAGGTLSVSGAVRWRRDLLTRTGNPEWLRDMTLGEARLVRSGGDTVSGEALLWRGVFIRHRASPFLLVPGPRPLRVPFPFDVGLLVEVGGARAGESIRQGADVVPIRSALLLDVAGHGRLRRLSFGPEVSWAMRIEEGRAAVHRIAPFTAGVVDALAESADGLLTFALTVRGGSSLAIPGGAEGFFEASLDLARVVLAVNDRPVALFVEGRALGGASGRGVEGSVGLRIDLRR